MDQQHQDGNNQEQDGVFNAPFFDGGGAMTDGATQGAQHQQPDLGGNSQFEIDNILAHDMALDDIEQPLSPQNGEGSHNSPKEGAGNISFDDMNQSFN